MTVSGHKHQAFADFEKAAWVRLSESYDALAGQMTRQTVDAILDAVHIRPGDALLDVASGFGYVAAKAKGRGANPIGVDFSPEMIEGARLHAPDIRIEIGDAENLAYADASFDAVVCAFGMLHFPRPGRALAEARRVLRPGGRHAFTVWCDPAKTRLFAMIGEAMQKHADMSVGLPPGPGAFMLSDPLICEALMDAAGFSEVRLEELPCQFRMTSSAGVLEFMRKCSPRANRIYEHQPAEIQQRITRQLMEEGSKVVASMGGTIPCPALLVVGTRPA